ncbi:hypothetical protein C8F04DRAFT_134575 [Mycena alexandri]|uniref:Short-chain dehydrogenase/reductase n=1 Tax=Mycena alexandri TaxID=1745969 RepID=A0AAD6SDT2_9AGAR|nr:hypothetical protein C8F04DRAFT_1242190 [Mycena alexandri]KAJ7025620.1 hypothetical protein C8F04DRAFT_134575 [Mycena alexandri]
MYTLTDCSAAATIVSAPAALNFGPNTIAEEASTPLANEIRGKNVLITGTSVNGLGFEAGRAIAKHANLVILTGYNCERHTQALRSAEKQLMQDVPDANIRTLVLDLASLAAVRIAAAEVNAFKEPIHVLIHNAASSLCGFKLTADGFEHQIATDHLGPFLFTALILPNILASQNATFTPRVVYVSSSAHAWVNGVDFAELEHPTENAYNPVTAYAQAKSANILTARELTRRAGGRINAYSLTPGAVETGFFMKASEEGREELLLRDIITENGNVNPNALPWKTVPQGAATLVTAAFDPSLNDKPGCYLSNSAEHNISVAAHASDSGEAEKLWALTEHLVGVEFSFSSSVPIPKAYWWG